MTQPDIRFTLANERTYLAWLRTALALLAAGVALDILDLDVDPAWRRALIVALVVLGMLAAATGWWRWARAERAMRQRGPLPALGVAALLTAMVVGVSVVLLVAVG